MSPFSSEQAARTSVRVLQIIVGALTMGVLMFTGVAVLIVLDVRPGQPQRNPMVAYIAAGLAPILLGLRMVVGGIIAAGQRRMIASDSGRFEAGTLGDRLLMAFQQKTIVERALVEGGLFLVLVSFLIDRQWWSLAVAAVLLIGLVLPFPTYDGAASWVRQQVELVELNRQS